MRQERVILYFGSFNPIHNGHMTVAEYVLAEGMFDELWFVVSPQNPFKPLGMLAEGEVRLEMVRRAIAESEYADRMRVCDVEFELPLPSFTINTMNELERRYEDKHFSILMGADSAASIEGWRDWRTLLERYEFYVYPREGSVVDDRFVLLSEAPLFDCSSTRIRELVGQGESVDTLVCDSVAEYIKEKELWR